MPRDKHILSGELLMLLLVSPYIDEHLPADLENPVDLAQGLDSEAIR